MGRRTGVHEEGFSVMRIVSVNVGLPREVSFGDETVRTG